MTNYFEDFYEPSEFEEECYHLKEIIKKSALKEVENKINKLESENARMKDIVENYDNKVKELEKLKSQFESEKQAFVRETEQKARKAKLKELFVDYQIDLYTIRNTGKLPPKCNKCDDDRVIHFKSPLGREHTECCECSKRLPYYEVAKANISEIRFNREHSMPWVWYSKYKDEDPIEIYDKTLVKADMIDNYDFANIEKYYNAYFRDKNKAQEYADWLNKKEQEK